ncbi:MAG: hypothetical protein ACR2NN_23230 [Bryobacteraceae bacterium]
MRRISATLLLGIISFSLIGPAFAGADSKLPACCRRDGKHRCAMMNMAGQEESSSGLAVNAARQKCPNYPKAGAVQAYSKTVLLTSFQTMSALTLRHPAIQKQTETHYPISFSRSRQKRGPPIVLT